MPKEHETNTDTVEKPAQTDSTATEPQAKGKNAKTGCLTFVILFLSSLELLRFLMMKKLIRFPQL